MTSLGQSETSGFDAAPCGECRAKPGEPCARWCSSGAIVMSQSGAIDQHICETCGGDGEVCVGFGIYSQMRPGIAICPDCGGTGHAEPPSRGRSDG